MPGAGPQDESRLMFTDAPFLSLAADLRHRELLAEAEQFRLARLARAGRRAARATRRRAVPVRAPATRPPVQPVQPVPTGPAPVRTAQKAERGNVDADCR